MTQFAKTRGSQKYEVRKDERVCDCELTPLRPLHQIDIDKEKNMLHQEDFLETKTEITFIQAIKNSNEIWELINSCDPAIDLLQQKLEKKIEGEAALLLWESTSNHFIKLYGYVASEKPNIKLPLALGVEESNINEFGETLLHGLSQLKNYLENKQKDIYLQVENILKIDKEIANIPETKTVKKLALTLNCTFTAYSANYLTLPTNLTSHTVEIYPLNLALDKNIIDLLLQYGANPNLRGYDPLSSNYTIPLEYEYFTALETACSKYQYYKALSLLSYSQYEINPNIIKKSLNLILNKHFVEFEYKHEIITSKTGLELLQKFSEKSSIKLLLEVLEDELVRRENIKALLQTIPDDVFFGKKRSQHQVEYDFRNNNINIFGLRANQNLSFSIWAVLLAGAGQNDCALTMLPHDIRYFIITILCHTNHYEYVIDRMNREKLKVFKDICISLMGNGLHKELFFACKIFDLKSDASISDSINTIKNIYNEPKLPLRSRMLLLQAWELACDSYEDFSNEQDGFLKLMKKAESHSIINALYKIQTIMLKYDSNLKSHILLDFDKYEKTISLQDLELLARAVKMDASSFYQGVGHSYEDIILQITKKITEDKQNNITDTELAWNLSVCHHLKFNSQNQPLIQELTQWAITAKKKYYQNSSYSLKVFSLFDNFDFTSIEKEVVKYINELDKDKSILSKYADVLVLAENIKSMETQVGALLTK
jgi:hypothetical protein